MQRIFKWPLLKCEFRRELPSAPATCQRYFFKLFFQIASWNINPARTVAAALPNGRWTAGGIDFVAPIGGMLLAVELYRALRKGSQVACAKWNHDPRQRCIFCGHPGTKSK